MHFLVLRTGISIPLINITLSTARVKAIGFRVVGNHNHGIHWVSTKDSLFLVEFASIELEEPHSSFSTDGKSVVVASIGIEDSIRAAFILADKLCTFCFEAVHV